MPVPVQKALRSPSNGLQLQVFFISNESNHQFPVQGIPKACVFLLTSLCSNEKPVKVMNQESSLLLPFPTCQAVTNTCQLSGFVTEFSGAQTGPVQTSKHSLATLASSPSEKSSVPSPACPAVLLRLSRQALKIHNELSFCLLVYGLEAVRP